MSPSCTYPSGEHSRHHALTDFCETRNSLVKATRASYQSNPENPSYPVRRVTSVPGELRTARSRYGGTKHRAKRAGRNTGRNGRDETPGEATDTRRRPMFACSVVVSLRAILNRAASSDNFVRGSFYGADIEPFRSYSRILVAPLDVSPRSKVTPSTGTCKYFRSPNARPEGSYRETSAGSTGQTVDILVGH